MPSVKHGIGRRLRMPRFILMTAMKVKKFNAPGMPAHPRFGIS